MSLTLTLLDTDESGGDGLDFSFTAQSSGDLLIAVACAGHGGGGQFNTGPSGFTQQYLDNAATHSNHSFAIYAKVSDGTETAADFDWNSTKTGSGFIYGVASDAGALTLSDLSTVVESFTSQTSHSTGDTTVDTTNEAVFISGIDTAGTDGGWDTATSPYTAGVDLEGPVGSSNSKGCLRTEYLIDTDGETDEQNTIGWTTSRSGFGFMIWVEEPDSGLAITPAAETVNVTAGTLTVDMNAALTGPTVSVTAGTAALSIDIPLTGPTVSVTPGTATVTPGAVDITPDPTTVSVTAGTLTVATITPVTPAPVTVTATAGTVTVDMNVAPVGAAVSVTPGAVTLDMAVDLTGAAVSVSPGTVTVVESQPVTPGAVTVTATPGTVTVDMDVPLTGPTVSVTPGTVTVANASGGQDITPDPTTVSVTPGTVTVIQEQFIVPDPTTVTVTAGTLSVVEDQPVTLTGPTVTVTAGAVTLDMNVALTGASVTATSGTLTVAPGAVDITPENVTVTVTPGTLVLGGTIPGQIHLEGGVAASRLGGSVQSTSRGGTLTASRTE